MRLFVRYSFAFVGGFLAMSAHIYLFFGRGDWLAPQRLSVTIGNALIFAHILAFMVIIVRDMFSKSRSLRIVIAVVGGTIFGSIAWFSYLFLRLYQAEPDILTIISGGFGLSVGFMITSFLNFQNHWLKILFATLITTIAIYIPIYLAHQTYIADSSAQALLYFQADNPNDIFLIGLPFALTIAFFGNLPLLFNSSPHAET